MVVSLYTSRVVLRTLGFEDFGIYNVVGGFVGMLAFLNSAMAASTQRFLTFELGNGTKESVNQIFSLSIKLHFFLAILAFIVAESLGLWFINTQLVIPETRNIAMNAVFQFSLLSLILNICSVPLTAVVLSKERMEIFAYISILDVLLRLVIAYVISSCTYDHLVVYSILLTFVSVINISIYIWVLNRRFKDIRYVKYWDRSKLQEMTSFAGWNMFGVFAGISYNQGINILLNMFFGVIVNAARSICYQVIGAVNQLVTNFQLALNPPITKSYAKGDIGGAIKLVGTSSKFSFLLLLFVIVPVWIYMPLILSLWLGEYPNYTVQFVRLVLIEALINSLSGPLQIIAQATGKIKKYQIIVGIILMSVLPITYVLFSLGLSPMSTFVSSIIIALIALIGRLAIIKEIVPFFSAKRFFVQIVFRTIITGAIVFAFSLLLSNFMNDSIAALALTFIINAILIISFGWICSLSGNEKDMVIAFVRTKILKK